MNDSTDNVVWKAYLEQNELGHDIIIILPDNKRIYALGSILAAKAPALIALMNTEVSPKEIDLTSSDLLSSSIKAVLDFVHGAHDTDPPRIALTQDYTALCSTLHAADYCGAEACKSWVENVIIKDHISSLDPNELRRLTENARAFHADPLYEAASKELAKRAPVDVLAKTDSQVLAEIVDRHVDKRQSRTQELAVVTFSGKLLIYDSATGSSLRTVDAHSDIIRYVAYSFDSSMIATASIDRTARLWNADTYACLHTLQHNHDVWAVAFSKLNRSVVASCDLGGFCKIWKISNGECLKRLRHGRPDSYTVYVFSVAWSPSNETQLTTGANDNNVRIWNTDTSECSRVLVGHEECISSIAYSLDGITLVSASLDRTCRLWNVANGTELRIFRGVTAAIGHVVFSPDGHCFATSGFDNINRIWHGFSGSCLKEFRGTSVAEDYKFGIRSLSYSPDGTVIACGCHRDNDDVSTDDKVGILDVRTGECVRSIDITEEGIIHLAFRPPLPRDSIPSS